MAAEPASRPWRSYLRFSVRGLIVLVLVIGAGLGWIVRTAHIQRDAVAAIERAGGAVAYDSGWTDNPTWMGHREPWAPKWLVDALGVDFFGHVFFVRLAEKCSDQELAQVGRLPRLDSVAILGANVTDLGLAHLKGTKNLRVLYVQGTQITDAGLVHLKGVTNLSELYLYQTRVSDAGLVHLKGLTNLSVLWLDQNQVTGAGKKDLKQARPNLTIAP